MLIALGISAGLVCALLLVKYRLRRRGIAYTWNVVSYSPNNQEADAAVPSAAADEAPVVRIVHAIITQALHSGASAIRFSPGAEHWEVSYLIDGVMHSSTVDGHVLRFPNPIYKTVIRRLKVMGDINPFSQKGPQEGTISARCQDEDYRLHVSFPAAPAGESALLTIDGPIRVRNGSSYPPSTAA
jgi:type II secretory ATPase GspE/PulE/Tfp pilus assembly ATPase PilB-like protein